MEDVIKTSGQPKSAKPGAGGGPNMSVPLFGVVKDNIDPNRAGRIKVLLGDKPPMDSDNSSNWVTVSYMSNFFGRVSASAGLTGTGSYKDNASSYGEWHAPPDIGTTVICVFINGDPNYGYYIGCVPEAESLHMVPAIGSSDNIVANEGESQGYGGAVRLPVTNMNTNNAGASNSNEFNNSPRPVHSYTASIMNQQGIIRDPIRGPISSSASREAASRVGWGVSTPGRPIYQGGFDDSTVANNLTSKNNDKLQVVARRGGHSLVMDDGDVIGRDQLIRLRTALGHQILMSDDGQTLMILHSNGQSYIELGKEGTIDMYSTNSVNIRTQGDLNLHADQDINMHAMGKFNLQAKSINTNSETTTQMRAATDINFGALGKITGLAGGAIAWGAGGDASIVAGGQAYVNGSKVNLNSGAPSTSPASVPNIPLVAQTDTLYDQSKGYMAAPAKLLTVCSRAPAHAPWANAGQGVDAKTNLDSAANLPPAPTPAVNATNAAGTAASPSAPATATVASAPITTAVSPAISTNTTGATLAAQATAAANGPAAAAVNQGAAVIATASGNVAAVGAFAQTASQLVGGNILKPGADTLINGLVQQGMSITQAMPSSLFSGVAGATNLTSLIQSTTAQASGIVTSMQKSQTALVQVGAISGKEAPAALTGLVNAATTVGINATVGALQQSAGSVTSALSGTVNGALGAASGVAGAAGVLAGAASGITNGLKNAGGSLSGAASGALNSAVGGAVGSLTGSANQIGNALKAIGSGSAAASLATSLTGGLGGVASALTAMNSVPSLNALLDESIGISASAFNAIKNSFVPLQAGVPQNLTAIAKAAASTAATVAQQTSQASGSLLNNIAGAANGGLGAALSSAVSGVTGGLGSAISGVTNGALGAVSGLVGGAAAAVNATNSSLSSLAGATGIINNSTASITGALTSGSNLLSTAVNAVGGTSLSTTIGGVTGAVNSISNAVTGSVLNTTIGGVQNAVNNIAAIAGAGSSLASGGLPALSNAAAVIQQGVSAATSSALASGLSNLPGGINTVSSVINNAPNAINSIPGASTLSGAISQLQTAAMSGAGTASGALGGLTSAANNINGIISSGTGALTGALTGAASGLLGSATGALSSLTNGLTSKAGGLSALASAGLPVGAIAQLQSSLASLSSGGASAINLPTVGFNTNDRTSITAQTTSLLGDPGIPSPNLTGEVSASTIDSFQAKLQEHHSLEIKYDALLAAEVASLATSTEAQKVYLTTLDDLPKGDVRIEQARQVWLTAIAEVNVADKALQAFEKEHPEFA